MPTTDPRFLPAALAAAMAPQLAGMVEGEVREVVLAMEDPPPADADLMSVTKGGIACFRQVGRWGGRFQARPPLLPGEVYRVECPECFGSGSYEDHALACDGASCHPTCPVQTQCRTCHGTGHLDLRCLSIAPERSCEEPDCAGGRVERPPTAAERFARAVTVIVDCPTCHGTPPWARWRARVEGVA